MTNPGKKTIHMEKTTHITHINEHLKSSFDDFTKRLEEALGKLDRSVLEKIPDSRTLAEDSLKEMGGLENLILFHIEDHGAQLSVMEDPKKAKLYFIGHPLISTEMTSIDIRTGLYHPLRLLVYVAEDDRTYVEYDLPSSLFNQFNRNGISQTGEMLDLKIKNLIDIIDWHENFRLADQVF
jgi:uncharacterized protein (DUF302 family)